jgi:hypothetical protein
MSKTMPLVTPRPRHDPAAVTALKILKSRVQSGLQKYRRSNTTSHPRRAEYASDFARLARRLCGKSVGIVLGGGGARGIAHVVGTVDLFFNCFLTCSLGCSPCFRRIQYTYRLRGRCDLSFERVHTQSMTHFSCRHQYRRIRWRAICPWWRPHS